MNCSKRAFDLSCAGLALLLCWPLFLLIALLVKLEDRGEIFFHQERVGYKGKTFRIWKFRTMAMNAEQRGKAITVGRDPRITRIGYWLRQFKLDELPQLFNVIKGEMSFVGPRPEVQRYVNLFKRDYAEILTVRPGITDLASLQYRNEAELLGLATDPEDVYIRQILPEKIRLAKEYIARSSFWFDLHIMVKTALALLQRSAPPVSSPVIFTDPPAR